MMPYKLLLVDDEKNVIKTLEPILISKGYDVVVAYDGEEALIKVKEENPDIILLDLMMPKLDGYQVLKQIREKYTEKWRPVIISSAKDELSSVKECYNLEADHYLIKPYSIENLLRGIEIMISLIPLRKTNNLQ